VFISSFLDMARNGWNLNEKKKGAEVGCLTHEHPRARKENEVHEIAITR
jgi:hypothetical protein